MAVLTDGLRVEVGYGSTPLTALSAVSWTDVTSSVRLGEGVQFNRGRFGNDASARPGSLSFTLDNGAQKGTAGRFTSGGTKVELRVPVRVSVYYPYVNNLVSNPSFETNTTGWSAAGTPTATIARSTVRASQGSASGLVTWGTGAAASQNMLISCATTAGTRYTFSMDVYVPSGSASVYATAYFVASGSTVSVKDQWVRTSVSFTATGATTLVGVGLGGAATSGQTCYIDGAMLEVGSVASQYQAGTPTQQSLWVGYVETVSAGWDGGYRPVLRVTASDRLARLEKRKLPSLIRGEQSVDSAVALWPLTDDVGSLAAGQQAGGSAPDLLVKSVGTDGALAFGDAGLAPGPDGLSCAVLTPNATETQGKYLYTADVGSTFTSATDVTVELFFYVPDSTGGQLLRLTDGADSVTVGVGDFGGTNCLNTGGVVGTTVYGGIPSVAATVGQWHHVAMTQTISGTTVTVKVFLDGTLGYTWTYTRASIIRGPKFYIGIDTTGTLYYGRVSHVALYASALSDAVIADHALLRYTLTSYTEQAASAIFNRICGIAGLPATEYQVSGTTAATMSPVPVRATGLLTAAELVAIAEDGVIYLNRSGVLTLAARTQRQNPTSAFSIPAKCVDRSTSFSTDMSYMVNDVTVKRPAGITTRYVNTTSTAAYDTHDSNVEAYLATDNQAQELASRLARVNSTPAPRVSDIKVDLITGIADLDESAILTADVGTYFQVTNLPTGSPAATLHLFVEGMQHEVTDSAWQVTMTTTPASEGFYRNVWKLGDASLSQLGSTTVLAY